MAVLLALLLVACSADQERTDSADPEKSDEISPSHSSGPKPGKEATELTDSEHEGNGTLRIEFDVSGDETVTGSVAYSPLSFDAGVTSLSCRGFAEGGKTPDELGAELGGVRFFSFPWLDGSDGVDGKFVSVTIGVSDYKGPNTYTENDNLQVSPSEVGLVIDDSEFTLPRTNPSTTLVVNADGSGSWNFPRLESHDGGAISGTMTWTCND